MDRAWEHYLDALDALAAEVDRALADGDPPRLTAPDQPRSPVPEILRARRDALVAALAARTARLEQRRDVLRSELLGLAPPRAVGQGEREASLGRAWDAAG